MPGLAVPTAKQIAPPKQTMTRSPWAYDHHIHAATR